MKDYFEYHDKSVFDVNFIIIEENSGGEVFDKIDYSQQLLKLGYSQKSVYQIVDILVQNEKLEEIIDTGDEIYSKLEKEN